MADQKIVRTVPARSTDIRPSGITARLVLTEDPENPGTYLRSYVVLAFGVTPEGSEQVIGVMDNLSFLNATDKAALRVIARKAFEAAAAQAGIPTEADSDPSQGI